MTDYVVPPNLTTTLTLVDTDTLSVSQVGSIVVDGDDAVILDLTGTAGPPGIVMVNQGLIQSLTDRAIDSQDSSGGGPVTSLTNHGTITSPDDAFRINDGMSGGTVVVDNHGTISTTGEDSGQAIDFNNITAAASVTITNRAGATIGSADADGVRTGANAVLNNYGDITAGAIANDSSDGVDTQDKAGVTVNNFATGTITGARHGITGDAPVLVDNAGTIVGSLGSGINLDTVASTTTVVRNQGTIEGNALGDQDGDGIDVDGLLDLINDGVIRAFGTWSGGLSEAIATGGGEIINNQGATIFGAGRGITVDDGSGGNAAGIAIIENNGTIEGQSGEAIRIFGTHNDRIDNKGTILGSISTDSGDDTLNLFTGSSVVGQIDGGAHGSGGDEINLDGTGAGTLSDVSNIEALNVLGGIWTITDDQAYAGGVTISAGAKLVVGQGFAAGSLDAGVVTNGVFAVDRGDVFTVTGPIEGGGFFEQQGDGTTVLDQANGYAGGTLLSNGALRLSALGAAGNGKVTFGDGGQTLILDDEALTANNLDNDVNTFGFGDAVDFTGLAFSAGATAVYNEATGLVTVTTKAGVYSFTAVDPGETEFTAQSDGAGGTEVVLKDIGAEIRGTKKNDTIDGQKTVLGQPLPTAADDSINGRRGNDKIAGLDGADELIGSDGDDSLAGGDGDDWLYGGTGSNKLSGDAGFNAFVFDTKLGAGKAGEGGDEPFSFSKIKDFTIGEDQILLDSKVFKALDPGALSQDAFAIGKKAKSDEVHVLFKDGSIRYDGDGEGGNDAVLFAKVGPGLPIDADDFLVI